MVTDIASAASAILDESTFYNGFLVGWFVLSTLVFITLFCVRAPYGRYARSGWGPVIPATLGWPPC